MTNVSPTKYEKLCNGKVHYLLIEESISVMEEGIGGNVRYIQKVWKRCSTGLVMHRSGMYGLSYVGKGGKSVIIVVLEMWC